ncbi:S9 family peptidase [uncultured Dysosmobacter sp.]|uniref:alpha/beta hydrolase family protein n=1 Tax=uncultured Dysosmobacter sp. TaxID=2591384 RepID=UPI002628A694|nr:alpha/beta fold hydrolase [uncultured Dysosmobacter sp.]
MTKSPLRMEYLFADPPYDPAVSPADYDMLCVESSGAELYGEIMWPDGSFSQGRPCVVLVHGYPGVARNDDLAFALRRIGCVVITMHHRGAWGSQGKYLISNCVQDVVRICTHVQSRGFCESYHTDPHAVFLVGHSMGGNSVLQAARRIKGIRGLVLLAPYDPTCFLQRGEGARLMKLLRTGYILRSDGSGAILRDIQGHLADYAFGNAYPDIKDQNICCITGTLDQIAPPWMAAPLWNKLAVHETTAIQRLVELPVSHGLCGGRIAVIEIVARFIDDVCMAAQ